MPDMNSRPDRVQAYLTRRKADQAPVFQIKGQSGTYVRSGTEADMARFSLAEAAINSGGLRPREPAAYNSDTRMLTIPAASAPTAVRLYGVPEGLAKEVTDSINSRPASIRELFEEATKGYREFQEAQMVDPEPAVAVPAATASQRRGRLAGIVQRALDAVDRAVDRILGGPFPPPAESRPSPQAAAVMPRQPSSQRPVSNPSAESATSTAFSAREQEQAARSATLASLATGGTVRPRRANGTPGAHRKGPPRHRASRGPVRPRKTGTAVAPPGR